MSKKTDRAKKLKKSRNMCKNNGYSHALHTKDKPKKAKPSLANTCNLCSIVDTLNSIVDTFKSIRPSKIMKGEDN